jgi:hypothetical protein
MVCNVGKIDRYARIAIGVVIVILGLYANSWIGAIGLIPIITGITKYCPAYTLLKINTDKD